MIHPIDRSQRLNGGEWERKEGIDSAIEDIWRESESGKGGGLTDRQSILAAACLPVLDGQCTRQQAVPLQSALAKEEEGIAPGLASERASSRRRRRRAAVGKEKVIESPEAVSKECHRLQQQTQARAHARPRGLGRANVRNIQLRKPSLFQTSMKESTCKTGRATTATRNPPTTNLRKTRSFP